MKRIVIAAAGLLAGIGGLCGAWWLTAQRALDAELRLETQLAEHTVAERLTQRLEEMRRAESERPWFHYQNLYHDPKGASEGLSVVPSPIASGPAHPLIAAQFQMDSNRKVTLPTLNEELTELNAKNAAEQRAVRDEIARAADAIQRAAGPQIARVERDASEQRIAQARIAQLEARVASAAIARPSIRPLEAKATKQAKLEELPPAAFDQNVQANTIFQQLNVDPSPARSGLQDPLTRGLSSRSRTESPIRIWTSDLEWHTLPVEGKPTLLALRAVQTPNGTLLQGILTRVVDGEAIEGARPTRAHVGTAVGETGWRATLAVPLEVRGRAQFMRSFAAVCAVLMLVVLGVLWTLWRVEMLARDRARFAATAAHELRTPLASLRLYSDLVAEEEDDAKRAHYASEIASQTERLGRVVANVLEVTRLERGTFALHRRTGAIGRVMEECVARLRPQIEAAQCELGLRVAPDLPEIAFDPDALHHVVGNLVDNAEKFSRDATDRTIDVSVERAEGGVAITVSDRGPGVPEALLRDPRPFRRGAKAASAPAGLGLGLYLVDRIIRGHGGTLSAAPRNGGGAAIRVFLPAA